MKLGLREHAGDSVKCRNDCSKSFHAEEVGQLTRLSVSVVRPENQLMHKT